LTPAQHGILAWEDDPLSGAAPVERPAPGALPASLPIVIAEHAPSVGVYAPGTPAFRYWAGVEALTRGVLLWAPHLSARSWAATKRLRVHLDRGEDLNAFYDRKSLSFFHHGAADAIVYAAESPDVVCHQLGHAVLDALRPELWDVMSTEAAAFHESFADLSSILCGLELESLRTAVWKETGARLFRSSRLSRLAESLGRALRQQRPDLVAHDCLRDAVNAYFYRPPSALPPSGPASQLTAEPANFSRVFTGGAFEALALMLATAARKPTTKHLLAVARDFAALLVHAVVHTPIVPAYLSQIAAHMLEADRSLTKGRYGDALRTAFVGRGLLSLESATAMPRAVPRPSAQSRRGAAPLPAAPLELVRFAGSTLGLGRRVLAVRAPAEAPAIGAVGSALSVGEARTAHPDEATQAFVEYLVRRGRVDFGRYGEHERTPAHPRTRKTHVVEERGARLELVRRCFDCGLDPGWG
jgi:hypothetical protein